MQYIYLTSDFYRDHSECSEILTKDDRPYLQLLISIYNVDFAVPLRSNIKHENFVIWSDRANRCGLDFTKAVVISKQAYINTQTSPQLRQNEFNALKGKEFVAKNMMLRVIKAYKKAINNPDEIRYDNLRKFSTLQYFEEYIFLNQYL